MSHLIPEQRVDKNGVLTTKHVRAGAKPSTSRSALPAPMVAAPQSETKKRKAPTKQQLKPYKWSFTVKKESGLAYLLGLKSTAYQFTATENEIYGMMSRLDTGNALAFLEAGFRLPSSAETLLKDNNLEHLLKDNELALEAQERRIPVQAFIAATENAPEDRINGEFFMDGVETSGIAALDYNYSWDVQQGLIRLSDIKALGATRIKKADSWEVIGEALKAIAAGKANYSAEDMREVLDNNAQRTNRIRNSLNLLDRYGPGITPRIPEPSTSVMDVHDDLIKLEVDPERGADILAYASEVFSSMPTIYFSSEDFMSTEDLIRFHDAGVSAADVANQTITITQLDAIENEGIAPSVSGGWL